MSPTEFKRRRRALMKQMGRNTIAIIPTAREQQRNRDVHYPFRADSDFYYLTGFPEPEAIAVLMPGNPHGEYILFCREKDPHKEQWEGRRAGQQGAIENYGADDSFPFEDLDDILPGLMERCDKVYYTMGTHPDLDGKLADWLNQLRAQSRAGVNAPLEIIDLDHYIHEMRLFKSRAEIAVMRRAAKISAAAHKRVMQAAPKVKSETQLEGIFVGDCMLQGSRAQAYPPIVGGGDNATILHYTENDAELDSSTLLLIDAGCELENYASDITRTFPVGGSFSEPQRLLYELVLKSQKAAIKKVKPGNHWNAPHMAAVRVLTKGLVELGLLKGNVNELIKKGSYAKFYMHRTGHWLGMDVHDVGNYKVDGKWRVLEPGMVLTIEPGLYIKRGMRGVARKWQGIGIRIEDDVLVTKDGCDVLSKDVPKEVNEIETLMESHV